MLFLTGLSGGIDDPIENWEKVLAVNLDGAYYCAKLAGEIFRKQGSGSLIFTASMSGHIANVPQRQVGPAIMSALVIGAPETLTGVLRPVIIRLKLL